MNIVKWGNRAIAKARPPNEKNTARSAAALHGTGLVIRVPGYQQPEDRDRGQGMGNPGIRRIELDSCQRDEVTECRRRQKQRRDVKVEPTDAVYDTGRVVQLKVGVVDQVRGPPGIVK